MLLPRRMTTSAGKRNGMSVLLLVAARFSLDLEEYQSSASQEGHCLEPARALLINSFKCDKFLTISPLLRRCCASNVRALST